ncbi:beta-lactamase-like protein [Radiomyces spectabilis]|uniref:beta-lactamase-like protein n=1 Tax=Radiomyces spectabilis TaxID=64574 RepID=UPI002220828A|nr:beta-lactamase-like protein [Radiomyces spectabilis]KAI8375979.1 beta-lactamase-like protein [Radiomyces spectabilis]
MEEMVAYHQTSVSVVDPSSSLHFSQLGNLASTLPTEGWRSLYTKKDIVTCIEKIQAVRYEESLSLFSTLRLVAYSSGYCLGSANWLLETGFKKVAFLSSTSTVANRHPAPLDPAIIESADVIILSDLKKSSTVKEKTYEQEMHGALTNMAMALSNGHNAIFCMPTMGPLFDVIDAAYHYLRSIGKEIGKEPYQVPVYVVSPIAYRSLQYANICGEWMNAERQNMLYEPQMPLIHGPLLKSGALQTIHSMVAGGMSDNIREPCIVFTGDSTCISKGSIQWFLRHWGSKEQNACIFTALQRDIPANCRMRLLWTPLNARLLLSEMSTLLQTHWQYTNDSAKHILVPSHPNVDPFKEYWQHNNVNVHVYEAGDIVGIELHRQWERISISEQLANTICTDRVHTSGEDNVTYMPVTGLLQMYNHRLELHPLTSLRDNLNLRIHQRRYWDQADLHTLMHRLNMV